MISQDKEYIFKYHDRQTLHSLVRRYKQRFKGFRIIKDNFNN